MFPLHEELVVREIAQETVDLEISGCRPLGFLVAQIPLEFEVENAANGRLGELAVRGVEEIEVVHSLRTGEGIVEDVVVVVGGCRRDRRDRFRVGQTNKVFVWDVALRSLKGTESGHLENAVGVVAMEAGDHGWAPHVRTMAWSWYMSTSAWVGLRVEKVIRPDRS